METRIRAETEGVLNDPPQYLKIGPSEVAYWVVGEGEPLLLVHGYPVSGKTWRHVVARLANQFKCYVVDLPGAGETRWSESTDFRFGAQAETLQRFVDALHLSHYHLMGHDTGATIARRLATLDSARVKRFVLIGTEIPGHRPPWIELFQKTTNPKQTRVLRFLLSQRWFRHSSAGFGGCFHDKGLIDGEFKRLFVDPVVASHYRASGLSRYLLGIDWSVVDGMSEEHRRITAPTLLLWGADDPVFPVRNALSMVEQLPNCRGLIAIPNAKLFIQEEKPDEVAQIARDFLLGEAVKGSNLLITSGGGTRAHSAQLGKHSFVDGGALMVLLLSLLGFVLPVALWALRSQASFDYSGVFELRTMVKAAAISLVLPLLQIYLQVTAFGGRMIRGNRDGDPIDAGAGGRVARAHRNSLEALLPFVAAMLTAHALGISNLWTIGASALFFVARLVHAVSYTLGVTVIRSAAFYAGLAATAAVISQI